MKYVLGVDSGNTKTIALIARLNGQIVGFGRSGCGDIYNAGSAEKALQNVNSAIKCAMNSANCNEQDIAAATFNMAGANWPEDFALIERALEERHYGERILLVNDAVGALKAGAIDDWGVAITNGTGAAISAKSQTGQLWCASHWQEGGGGLSLGQKALRAVYRAHLGIQGRTSLTDRILSFYGIATVEELLHLFTRREDPISRSVSSLARLVLDSAETGDATARDIVREEGSTLGDYILAAARQVGIADQAFPLILAGSIFKHDSPLLTNSMLERVHSLSKGVTVIRSELEPSAGAVLMSLEAAGVKPTRVMRNRLKETTPPTSFFAT